MDNIFKKFTPNLQQALLMSERISREQKSQIDTEHQLLALILQKGTLANDILSMYEISIDRAQLVASLLSHQEPGSQGVRDDAKQAIQLAVQFAMKYKHNLVDCEHLLLSLISNKKFNSYNIVERMGVSPKDIKKQLETVFGETSKPLDANAQVHFEAEVPSDFDEIDMENAAPFSLGNRTAAKVKKGQDSIKEFTVNISNLAKNKKIDPVVGREEEIERMIQILIRRKKNNPVLIGEPGVGKTAIVEGLALRIKQGQIPPVIADKEILALDLPALLAGTMYRGQFEIRIKKLLEEIEKNQKYILFIDELHTIIGAGSAEGSLDAANILKPKLARGEIRVIGATTLDEYKKHIEKDAAFERRFQPILVQEPTVAQTLEILNGISGEYEKHHSVIYTKDALQAAADLSARYISDRFLPDKAIDLIDEAAAAVKIKAKDSGKLLILIKELDKTIQDKDEAVTNEQYEKATFLRQKELSLKNKIADAEKFQKESRKLVVTDEDIARVVSRWTGIPLNSLKISDKKRFINLEKRLSKFIIGQDEAINSVSSAIRRSRVGISNPNRPIGSFIFLGPTGVGKTELVKVMAKEIYGSDKALIKIDMSEFMEKHNVSRLVGAPAGYVGYDEGGQLTDRIRRNPYSIILFDEIEKAHPEVFNILLQILEDGELTDAKGRRVDFRNTMVIMTSNLGTEYIHAEKAIGFNHSDQKDKMDYDHLCEQVGESIKKQFRPEFINRLDQIIVFRPLDLKSIEKIVQLELNKLIDRLSTKNITITATKEARHWIAQNGYNQELGARPMRQIIASQIENQLSLLLLSSQSTKKLHFIINLKNDHINITES